MISFKKVKYFINKMKENHLLEEFLVQNRESLSMELNQAFGKIFTKLTLLNRLDCMFME